MKFIIGFIMSLITLTSLSSAEPVITRAAVDVGSGGIKVTVADVDPLNCLITKIHFSEERQIPLRLDLHENKGEKFSEKIQQTALFILKKYVNDMAKYQPTEWSGIATAASRDASNAQAMYDKINKELGIKIRIISQAEEARVGFETAIITSSIDHNSKLVSYDSGSGSFQLATEINGKLDIVEGKIGYIPALVELVEGIRGKQIDKLFITANPVSPQEANELVERLKSKIPKISTNFQNKIADPSVTVVGIGNKNFIFATGAIATGKETYSRKELWEAIINHCDKNDLELVKFTKPDEAVVGMLLLYSVMDELGIEKLTYKCANGSCEGILVDPKYWECNEALRKVI